MRTPFFNAIIAPLLLSLASCGPGCFIGDTIPGTYVHPSAKQHSLEDDTLAVETSFPWHSYRMTEGWVSGYSCDGKPIFKDSVITGGWNPDAGQLTVFSDGRIIRFGRGYLLIGNHIYYKR